jgi:2-keto-3-deoxy-L-rhamnonate aldolase RhmA
LRNNKLRELIIAGKPTIGTRLLNTWPGLVELIGHTGVFDFVEFVSEYAPFDLYDFENLARAAELVGISSMIKIDREPRLFLAGRAVSAGIQNVLFANIDTVKDAEEAVGALRAEPIGFDGLKMDRRMGYGSAIVSPTDIVEVCANAVVAIMIESKTAVDNIEEILSVDGIDMVVFGPSDYSLSIGMPGQTDHPRVREAELKTLKSTLEMGLVPRVQINNAEDSKRYIDMGVRNFILGTDVSVLYKWWKESGNELKKLLH